MPPPNSTRASAGWRALVWGVECLSWATCPAQWADGLPLSSLDHHSLGTSTSLPSFCCRLGSVALWRVGLLSFPSPQILAVVLVGTWPTDVLPAVRVLS